MSGATRFPQRFSDSWRFFQGSRRTIAGLTAAIVLAGGTMVSLRAQGTAAKASANAAASAAAGTDARTVDLDIGAQDPALSADGRMIAFSLLGDIWTMPAAGGAATRVTEGLSWDTHPAWSPDGQFLAYSQEGSAGAELVVRNLATGTSRVAYSTQAKLGQIAFQAGSGDLFFLLDSNQYDSHLWRIPQAGGEATQLTFTQNWHEWSFDLSGDGSSATLDSGRYGGSDLYQLSLKASAPAASAAAAGARAVAASDDEKNAAPPAVTRLTRTPEHEQQVRVSRDGRVMAFVSSLNGVDAIVVANTATGQKQTVFTSAYDGKQLSLSPDGSWAVLSAGRRLYRVDLRATTASASNATPIAFTARLPLPARARADLRIVNARVLEPSAEKWIANATVLVRDGKIVSVTPGSAAAATGADAGVPTLDAKGQALLPGLMDNHYHYWSPFDGGQLLSRGITSIRDPGSAIGPSLAFKAGLSLGVLEGPDLYTCGPLLDGIGGYHPMVDVSLDKPEAAAPLVRALKAQGVDALKVYFQLNPDVLKAIVKEARAQGLPVTGHIGVRTGLGEAMDAGIAGLSHIRVWRDFLPLDRQPQGENESLDSTRDLMARMQADWRDVDPDGQGATTLIGKMVSHKVGFDPTLAIQRIGAPVRKRLGLEEFVTATNSYARMSRFVANADRAGVRLLAGTDNGSLFDELEAYADAGVPPAAVLRAATTNGADWLGKGAEFGTIEPGKRAHLILVDGDPLKNVRDLRKLQTVIKDGRIVFRK